MALAEEDRHGYAVMKSVRERSGGRVRLETGPLYRYLSRLIDDGIVAETKRAAGADDPRRRCYYRLTKLGRDVLTAEAVRLAELVEDSKRIGVLAKSRTSPG